MSCGAPTIKMRLIRVFPCNLWQRRGYLVSSLFTSQAIHLLGEAALCDEVPFQSLQLLEEQVVGLVDKYNRHVGDGLWRTCMTQIHKKGRIVVFLSQSSHCLVLCRALFPLAAPMSAQIVGIVLEKFLKTCLSHVHEFYLRFCRGG